MRGRVVYLSSNGTGLIMSLDDDYEYQFLVENVRDAVELEEGDEVKFQVDGEEAVDVVFCRAAYTIESHKEELSYEYR